jgi:hypothetical protein
LSPLVPHLRSSLPGHSIDDGRLTPPSCLWPCIVHDNDACLSGAYRNLAVTEAAQASHRVWTKEPRHQACRSNRAPALTGRPPGASSSSQRAWELAASCSARGDARLPTAQATHTPPADPDDRPRRSLSRCGDFMAGARGTSPIAFDPSPQCLPLVSRGGCEPVRTREGSVEPAKQSSPLCGIV